MLRFRSSLAGSTAVHGTRSFTAAVLNMFCSVDVHCVTPSVPLNSVDDASTCTCGTATMICSLLVTLFGMSWMGRRARWLCAVVLLF